MGKEQTAKKPNKVVDVIVTVVLVLAIGFAIMCAYSAFTSTTGTGVATVLGYRPFTVASDSMAPTFYSGDLVIDKKVKDPSELKVGDIISFWTIINGQKVVNTHRIIAITDYGNYLYFDTQGDANSVADAVGVHQNDILGKYVGHLKGVGTVFDFLKTSKGFFICIVIPVAIFFIAELVGFIKTLIAYNTEKVKLQMEREKAAMKAEIEKEMAAAKATETTEGSDN